MKKVYMLGMVIVGWSGVSWTMDGDGEFKALDDRSKQNYGTVEDDSLQERKGDICSIGVHPTDDSVAIGYTGRELFYTLGDLGGTLDDKRGLDRAIVKFSADGESFVAAGGTNIQLSTSNRDVEKKLSQQHVSALTFSGNSQYLLVAVTGNYDNKLCVYDLTERQLVLESLYTKGLDRRATLLSAASYRTWKDNRERDLEKIALSSGQDQVIFYAFDYSSQPIGFREDNRIERQSSIHDIQFNNEGNSVALALDDGIEVLNSKDYAVRYKLTVNNDPPRCLTFYSVNKLLFGTQEGKLAHVDLEKTGNVTYLLHVYTDPEVTTIAALGANNDGSLIAFGGEEVLKKFSVDSLLQHSTDHRVTDHTLELDSQTLAHLAKKLKYRRRCCCAIKLSPFITLAAFALYYGVGPLIKTHTGAS